MQSKRIFELRTSTERNRPYVDYELPANAKQDWNIINHVLEDRANFDEGVPLEIHVQDPSALQWDFYSLFEPYGVFSKRACELLSPFAVPFFSFKLLSVNQHPYYLIKREQSLDCFDAKRSITVPFSQDDPSRIMRFVSYAFDYNRISSHACLFNIPEDRAGIFCTEPIVEFWKQAGFRGLRFVEVGVPVPPDASAR